MYASWMSCALLELTFSFFVLCVFRAFSQQKCDGGRLELKNYLLCSTAACDTAMVLEHYILVSMCVRAREHTGVEILLTLTLIKWVCTTLVFTERLIYYFNATSKDCKLTVNFYKYWTLKIVACQVLGHNQPYNIENNFTTIYLRNLNPTMESLFSKHVVCYNLARTDLLSPIKNQSHFYLI